MADLRENIRRNSGFSHADRENLITYLASLETYLANLKAAVNDLQTQHDAHCAATHSSADETNVITADAISDAVTTMSA